MQIFLGKFYPNHEKTLLECWLPYMSNEDYFGLRWNETNIEKEKSCILPLMLILLMKSHFKYQSLLFWDFEGEHLLGLIDWKKKNEKGHETGTLVFVLLIKL